MLQAGRSVRSEEVVAVSQVKVSCTGTGVIEVSVYRDDQLLARELCESEDDVSAVMDHWDDLGNVSFMVDDLSTRHTPEDVLAPEPPVVTTDQDPIATATLPDRGME